ncbi:hypothetical protein NDU88_000276 [Pleurodeles waltl]|uniref:Uncharacterized protein n=1 Tax=Pleurodeles waltl TaxID=8319 RepID=A0AAV7S440_PLEWA|nr:hypothetical protein NDU88_000276 [Pleurodeles waltl]
MMRKSYRGCLSALEGAPQTFIAASLRCHPLWDSTSALAGHLNWTLLPPPWAKLEYWDIALRLYVTRDLQRLQTRQQRTWRPNLPGPLLLQPSALRTSTGIHNSSTDAPHRLLTAASAPPSLGLRHGHSICIYKQCLLTRMRRMSFNLAGAAIRQDYLGWPLSGSAAPAREIAPVGPFAASLYHSYGGKVCSGPRGRGGFYSKLNTLPAALSPAAPWKRWRPCKKSGQNLTTPIRFLKEEPILQGTRAARASSHGRNRVWRG